MSLAISISIASFVISLISLCIVCISKMAKPHIEFAVPTPSFYSDKTHVICKHVGSKRWRVKTGVANTQIISVLISVDRKARRDCMEIYPIELNPDTPISREERMRSSQEYLSCGSTAELYLEPISVELQKRYQWIIVRHTFGYTAMNHWRRADKHGFNWRRVR